MQIGQAAELKSGHLVQRERVDGVEPPLFRYESIRIVGKWESAECELDGDLPGRDRGQVHLVRWVGVKLAGSIRERIRIGRLPSNYVVPR